MNIEEALILLRFDGTAATNGIRDTKKALSELTRGAADYGRQLGGSLSNVSRAVGEISKLGSGLAGVFAVPALVGLVNNTAEMTRNTANMADNVGIAVDKLTAFRRVAEQVGSSAETSDSFFKSIANKAVLLKSNLASISDVLPPQFFMGTGEGGADPLKAIYGTPEDTFIEFGKAYEKIKRLELSHGKSAQEAEQIASQMMIQSGVAESLLPMLKMGNEALKERLAIESKIVTLTEKDREVAKRYTEATAKAMQALEIGATKLFRSSAENTVDYIELLSKAIVDEMQDPKKALIDLANAIAPFLGGLDVAYNLLKKITDIDLSGVTGAIGTAYDKAVPVGMQQRDQNLVGNVAAFFGDKDAMAAKATIDKYNKDNGIMTGVFSAFQNAGFSPNQAKALTAEVGRENDFNPKNVFGSHTDAANRATNTGFFSWQGSRSTELKQSLAEKGLLRDGKIVQSQESLNAMAAFAKSEMESGRYKGAGEFLAKKDIGSEEAADKLGHGYIKWAMGQDRLKSGEPFDWRKHDAKRRGYYEKIDSLADSGNINTKDLVQQPTQSGNVTVTNNVTIDASSNDPEQVVKGVKSEMEKLSDVSPYSSGVR